LAGSRITRGTHTRSPSSRPTSKILCPALACVTQATAEFPSFHGVSRKMLRAWPAMQVQSTTWLQLAEKMISADTEHHAAKMKERAAEKADANQLDKPRRGTEWLDGLGCVIWAAEKKKREERGLVGGRPPSTVLLPSPFEPFGSSPTKKANATPAPPPPPSPAPPLPLPRPSSLPSDTRSWS
jgi:hypothetical protein